MTHVKNTATGPKTPRWISRAFESFFCLIKRILGLDVRSLARNATLVTISHGISMVRGLVTGYLVARLFPRELYGQYQFILSVVGTVAIFGIPGMGNALSRAIAKGMQGIALPVARIQFLTSLLGSLILIGIIPFLPEERQSLWPLFLLAALLFPVSQTANTLFTGITVGGKRFDVSLRANLVWSALIIAVTLFILTVQPSAILLFAAITSIPALIYLLCSRPFLAPTDPAPSASDVVRYGMQLTVVSLPMTLSWYLDKLIISAMFGLNQLAIFSVALLIPDQIKVWVKELLPISFALQANGADTIERRMRLIHVVGRMTLLFLVGIILYIACAPFLFSILLPDYSEAIFLSQLYSVSLLTMPSALFTQYLEAQGMITELRKSQWISAIVFTMATIALIPIFGLLGAVIARSILRITITCTTLFFLLYKPSSEKR